MERDLTPGEYNVFVMGLLNRCPDVLPNHLGVDMAHAVLGIYTEIYEASRATTDTNLVEEASDLLFYGTAAACILLEHAGAARGAEDVLPNSSGSPWLCICDRNDDDAEVDTSLNVPGAYENLTDAAKRWVGYGKAPDVPEALHDLRELMHDALSDIYEAYVSAYDTEWNFWEFIDHAMQINYRKLMTRYRGGRFDVNAALNRDLAAEAKVLSGA